ncbi:MAG: sulfite exporter TauE/SafE family protein [Marinagarivorans sp.]
MLLQLLPFLPYLALAGVAAGLLAGLFGIGGGAVLVPVLLTMLTSLQVPTSDAMAMALATSLACIVPTAVSSSYSHFKKQHVQGIILKRWWLGILMGTLLGAQVINYWRSPYLMLYFSLFLVFVAINQVRPKIAVTRALPAKPWHYLASFVQGFLSVLAGVGGGTIAVPILLAMGLSIHQAIGTSAALGLFISLFTSATMLITSHAPVSAPLGSVGLIFLPALFVVTPISSLMAPLGVKLNKRLPEVWLVRLFAVFLLLVAGRMGYLALAN